MSESVNPPDEFRIFDTPAVLPVGRKTKRAIDIILALSGILVFAPLIILCFIAVWLSAPGPVLFRHRRVGFQGQVFDCLKFQTMIPDAERHLGEYLESNPEAKAEWITCRKLRFDPRVTAFGSILRKTSLDELPQLFNVLKGEMSVVGPRPVTPDELQLYTRNIGEYLACRPGVTGLWQVSGRSSTTYSKRVACDAFYSRNWSLGLDAKIIAATLPSLLDSENAY